MGKTFPDYFEAFFSVTQPSRPAPVICIDGPTASGKGTIAAIVAERLGYHLLDSGALYRITGLAASRAGIELTEANAQAIADLVSSKVITFMPEQQVLLDGDDISLDIRTEQAGMNASRVATFPAVRQALLHVQRNFCRLPGLVGDGRDMGTTIFPDAPLKVYLTASVQCRAERRYKQLISKGLSANMADLIADLEARDARDMNRAASPLKPAQDALHWDNSDSTIDEAVQQVLTWWEQRQPFALVA